MKSENKLLKIKNNLHRVSLKLVIHFIMNSNEIFTDFITSNGLFLFKGIECFNTLMSRNGELREELKTLQLEEKQFLHVQSLLEKAG